MKIKLRVSQEKYAEIEAFLKEKGIEISDEADLILSEKEKYLNYVNAKKENEIYRIPTEKIIFIESYGKNMILHTQTSDFSICERLKELEMLLDPKMFLRISQSVLINCAHIKKIQPTFGMKFILTLDNEQKVDVTRSYYYIFRETFGI